MIRHANNFNAQLTKVSEPQNLGHEVCSKSLYEISKEAVKIVSPVSAIIAAVVTVGKASVTTRSLDETAQPRKSGLHSFLR